LADRDRARVAHRLQAGRAVTSHAGEEDADSARTDRARNALEGHVDAGYVELARRRLLDADAQVVVDDEVASARRDHHSSGQQPCTRGRHTHGQRAQLVEPVREALDEPVGHVLDDDHRRPEVCRQRPEEVRERLRSTGRCTDRDEVDSALAALSSGPVSRRRRASALQTTPRMSNDLDPRRHPHTTPQRLGVGGSVGAFGGGSGHDIDRAGGKGSGRSFGVPFGRTHQDGRRPDCHDPFDDFDRCHARQFKIEDDGRRAQSFD